MLKLFFRGTNTRSNVSSTQIAGIDFINLLSSSIILKPEFFVFDYLKNAGSSAMNVNGSVTPAAFRYQVPAGFTFLPKDINFYIQGANNTVDRFGGINGGLANGLLFRFLDENGDPLKDITGGEPIKKNGDFFLLASASPEFTGAVAVNFNILKTGAAIAIPEGGFVEVLVRDDLTSLTEFRVSINGLLMPGEITYDA